MTILFILTKLVLVFILPPASLIILMTAGLLRMKKHPGSGAALIWLGIVLLYAASIEPVSSGLINRFEREYPPFAPSGTKPDAIVVLSGGIRDLSWNGLEPEPAEASLMRVVTGVKLYRAFGGVQMVMSGGSGDPANPAVCEARAMTETAVDLGVPEKRIITECGSRNTLESAAAVAKLIRGRRIVLVTSAYHMHRAKKMFEKKGFHVTPAPTAYLSEQSPFSAYSFIPGSSNLWTTSTGLREQISRWWYSYRREM